MKTYILQALKLMTMLCFSLVIYGCGGSSSTISAETATVSGTVLAGPATTAADDSKKSRLLIVYSN